MMIMMDDGGLACLTTHSLTTGIIAVFYSSRQHRGGLNMTSLI